MNLAKKLAVTEVYLISKLAVIHIVETKNKMAKYWLTTISCIIGNMDMCRKLITTHLFMCTFII
jgi:hypothetical protein